MPIALQRILVPTDLSAHSLAGLAYAVSFGRHYGASIVLLHVAESVSRKTQERASPADQSHQTRTLRQGMENLRSIIDAHMPPGVPCEPVVCIGAPADEILRYVREERIDMVVMATHGRTGLQHIVMGSVAETVVRRSPVPVLTVKPAKLRESVIRNEDIESELHLR